MTDLTLTNALIHTPNAVLRGNLEVANGRIRKITSGSIVPDSAQVVDVGGRHVFPGLIDPHGIFGRVNWEGTAREESVHAAVNGITTIITYVQMGDLTADHRLPVHQDARTLCERESFVDFKFNSVVGTDAHIAEMPQMLQDGVRSFNFWMNLSKQECIQYGFPGLDWAFFYRAIEAIRDLGYPEFASVHCEEPEIIHMLTERAAKGGRQDLVTWANARPSFTEGAQAFLAGLIGLELGVPLSFVHVSASETLDAIRYLRDRGAHIYAETCPQYLSLSSTDDLGVVAKQMPPLRHRSNQDVLWRACADGTITMIGSDHQIARREDKEVPGGLWGEPTERAGSGGGLMGSIAPIMLSEGVNKSRISPEQFVKLCSENAARLYSIYPAKGALLPGSDADMIIVDMDRVWKMSSEALKSSSDYCLWDGYKVRGRVLQTYLRGKLLAEEGEMVASDPNGRYVY